MITPGRGAFIGEVHANTLKTLRCVDLSRTVRRDLADIEGLNLQLFSEGISVSHAYAHVLEFGKLVELAGL